MYRTLKIKLDRSNELVQTARFWNAACQDVIDYGFVTHDYNKTRLNKATYKDLREKYPMLPSALLQTARDQASDMLKNLSDPDLIKKVRRQVSERDALGNLLGDK